MKRGSVRRAVILAAALGMTALLTAAFPLLKAHVAGGSPSTPPGVRPAQRQLITVWIAGDLPGAASWLRAQAAAYEKSHPGASVWLRRVSAADIAQLEDAPPDLLIFSPDMTTPAGDAVPLCLSGYVLALPGSEAATAAPRSLFGVSPTPDPAVTPQPLTAPWPERFAVDDGFGLLALASLGMHPGAEIVAHEALSARLQAGEAALLPASQARGGGVRVLAAASATDLALYGMVCGKSGTGADFLRHLTDREAQRALAEQGLFPVLPDLHLYGADQPALLALEQALRSPRLAPPFTWPEHKQALILTAQALYQAGENPASLLDELIGL